MRLPTALYVLCILCCFVNRPFLPSSRKNAEPKRNSVFLFVCLWSLAHFNISRWPQHAAEEQVVSSHSHPFSRPLQDLKMTFPGRRCTGTRTCWNASRSIPGSAVLSCPLQHFKVSSLSRKAARVRSPGTAVSSSPL